VVAIGVRRDLRVVLSLEENQPLRHDLPGYPDQLPQLPRVARGAEPAAGVAGVAPVRDVTEPEYYDRDWNFLPCLGNSL
jgi:hypothetical protein